MALRLMELDKIIDNRIIKFLLSGGVWTTPKTPVPNISHLSGCETWFNEIVWTKIEEMSNNIELFNGFSNKFIYHIATYDEIFSDIKCIDDKTIYPALSDLLDKKDKK